MKKLLVNCLVVFALTLSASSVKAQLVMTEYFKLTDAASVEFNEKEARKVIVTKGVKDIEWNADTRTLAITYDPKVAPVEEISKKVKELTGADAVAKGANTTGKY